MRPLSFLLICLISSVRLCAQGDGLAELNQAFGGRVSFDIDHEDRLIVDHHDASGHYRQDVAYVEFLDPQSIAWSEEEKAILVRCLPGQEQCIDKEIFKMKTIRPTGRMNLSYEGDPMARQMTMNALSAWITQEQERIAGEGSETKVRPQRKR